MLNVSSLDRQNQYEEPLYGQLIVTQCPKILRFAVLHENVDIIVVLKVELSLRTSKYVSFGLIGKQINMDFRYWPGPIQHPKPFYFQHYFHLSGRNVSIISKIFDCVQKTVVSSSSSIFRSYLTQMIKLASGHTLLLPFHFRPLFQAKRISPHISTTSAIPFLRNPSPVTPIDDHLFFVEASTSKVFLSSSSLNFRTPFPLQTST